MFYTLLEAATTTETTGMAGLGGLGSIIWIGVMIAIFYFMIIRPQKKQQREQENLMASIKPGDSIMTSSGFYGVILDIIDDTVIVEFGNNKNCRIPMNKAAIVQVQRDDEPEEAEAEEKKPLFGKKKD